MALLLVDCYHGDFYGANAVPRWNAIVDARAMGFIGAILKSSDGLIEQKWFRANWSKARNAAGERRGRDWFVGAYHFLRFDQQGGTPEQQADAYARNVEAGGGMDANDILPIVDAERGAPGSRNYAAGKQQVIEWVTRYAARINSRMGRKCMLYGRGIMRDLGIRDKMGCVAVWNPSYTERMATNGLDAWRREEILLWQYTDGKVNKTSLPSVCPGFGQMDLNVFLGTIQGGGNMNDLDVFRKTMCGGNVPVSTLPSQTGQSTSNADNNSRQGAPQEPPPVPAGAAIGVAAIGAVILVPGIV